MIVKTKPITSVKNAFSVEGYNVVVTGGNRGIGYGISYAFAEAGANVAILCRNEKSGKEAVEKLQQFGGRYTYIHCDISDMQSTIDATEEIYKFYDHVDVLVNNAGVATTTKFLDDENMSEWYRVVNTNLHGPANMIHAVAPKMKEAGLGGSIINISSIGGQSTGSARTHFNPPYHASKAGLDHFMHYMAIELGDYGIRVNCIAPGPTHSDLDKDLPPDAIEKVETGMPMHRFAEPIEIGALCIYLASPAGNQVTGTVVVHDGGLLTLG